MTRFSPGSILLSLLILFASLPVAAREVRLQAANGEGDACPDAAAAGDEQVIAQAGATTRRTKAAAAKGKTPPSARRNDVNVVRAPRWHSFLPGMFR